MTVELVRGHLYRFSARNFSVGVCVNPERSEFIGIREKFGSRYLSTERGWHVIEDLGPVPADLSLAEILGSRDSRTGFPVHFDRPVAIGGRGWYFVDTDESSDLIRPEAIPNTALFDYLDGRELS